MVWRGDIEKHYENVTKTYEVMNLLDQDDLAMRNGLRTVIVEELIKSCKCIIEWIGDENNRYSKIASDSILNLQLGYDICNILEIRTFIYQLLDKPLSELFENWGDLNEW